MDLERAENIIDNMYKEKCNERVIETENGITVDLSKNINFTELEEASVIVLRTEIKYKNELERLQKENELYKHRLEVANGFIESRIDNMIPEHYEDLKYIINECDMNSTW